MHTPEYKKVLGEMVRVTKKGGFIIADLPNKNSLSYFITNLRIHIGEIRYYNFFSDRDVKLLSAALGIEVVKTAGTTILSYKIVPKFAYPLIDTLNRNRLLISNFSYVNYTKFRKLSK